MIRSSESITALNYRHKLESTDHRFPKLNVQGVCLYLRGQEGERTLGMWETGNNVFICDWKQDTVYECDLFVQCCVKFVQGTFYLQTLLCSFGNNGGYLHNLKC